MWRSCSRRCGGSWESDSPVSYWSLRKERRRCRGKAGRDARPTGKMRRIRVGRASVPAHGSSLLCAAISRPSHFTWSCLIREGEAGPVKDWPLPSRAFIPFLLRLTLDCMPAFVAIELTPPKSYGTRRSRRELGTAPTPRRHSPPSMSTPSLPDSAPVP